MWLTVRNMSAISLPSACTFIGFIVGLNYGINEETNIAIQYTIAGILFAALATEIVPIITESEVLRHRLSTVLGLILGATLMISTRGIMISKYIDESAELFVTGAIDVTIGGLIIGTSTATAKGFRKYIFSGALSIDNFFLGIISARKMKNNGKSTGYILSAATTLSVCIFFAGITGMYIADKSRQSAFYFTLSFGVSSLLWLIGAELLAKDNKSLLYPSMLYVGFILVIVLNWTR